MTSEALNDRDYIRYLSVRDYIKTLFTSKQSLVVESVWVYAKVSDSNSKCEVYTTIINIDRNMLKKAKRLGIINCVNTTNVILHQPQILTLDSPITSHKRIIIIYDNRTKDCNIYEGETTEEEQIEDIRERSFRKRLRSHRRY